MWSELSAFLDFAEKIYSNTVKDCRLGSLGILEAWHFRIVELVDFLCKNKLVIHVR